MIARSDWTARIEKAWNDRPVVWLSGVRRSGKTILSRSLAGVEFLDCERPRTRQALEDVEGFLDSFGKGRLVLDEIHRLPNPSEILKVAADHYPEIRILATGSSTLGASEKFSDTLAGRKRNVWLTPMTLSDMQAAGKNDMRHRLLYGGLPPFFLSGEYPEADFSEWIDAYWARDIQGLFQLARGSSFRRFTELVMAQSGGIFEATRFSVPCEVSRPTITRYLSVLEATFVAHVIRPYHTQKSVEITSAPRVYGFDTGFVAWSRGWTELRQEDLDLLWEHFVLNEIMAARQTREIYYWRDKRGHEVDFVLAPKRGGPVAVECKWSAAAFDPAGFRAFRHHYPEGENIVLAQDVDRPVLRRYGEMEVRFERLSDFALGRKAVSA